MSTNISGNVEVGGLLSHEYLRMKNTTRKPLTGQKLSALKNAVTLQKKSEDGGSDAGAVKLLRRTEEEREIQRERPEDTDVKNDNTSVVAMTTPYAAAANTKATQEMVSNHLIYAEATELIENHYENSDRAFVIDGVGFSGDEMKAVKEVVRSAVKSVGKRAGSNLDYNDYAQMGIAENQVRAYATENLTEEQAEVVNRTVSGYMNHMIRKEMEASYVIEDRYYGKRNVGDDIAAIKQYTKDMVAKSNLPEQTKRVFAAKKADAPVMAISASNAELANLIRSTFANANMKDEVEWKSVFQQYQKWMKPAYLEYYTGLSNEAEQRLQRDAKLFEEQFRQIRKTVQAVNVSHVDIQI